MFVILQAYNASLNRMPTSLKLVCIQVKNVFYVFCVCKRERERERERECVCHSEQTSSLKWQFGLTRRSFTGS